MDGLLPLPRTPLLRLDGKRAMVTGAGRGIGLAAAAALAEAGAHVPLVARNHDEIEAVSGPPNRRRRITFEPAFSEACSIHA